MYPYVHCSIIYNSKIWKQSKCPSIDKWIKMWCIYIMKYYLAIKKNEILPFATTRVDLEGIMLSGIERQILYDFTYGCNLKTKQNK